MVIHSSASYLEFCKDIREVAHPDCLLLNYANPMAMNTWAGERLVSAEEVVTSGGEHLAKERLLVRARQALTDARMHLPEGIRVEADMIEGPTHDVLIDAARSHGS